MTKIDKKKIKEQKTNLITFLSILLIVALQSYQEPGPKNSIQMKLFRVELEKYLSLFNTNNTITTFSLINAAISS